MTDSSDGWGGMLTGAGVRVLLVGTGRHKAGSELTDLVSVSTTVADLATTLVERCGAPLDQVRPLVDPANPEVFGQALRAVVEEAEDVLVVCYLGHGLLDRGGELYLATQASDRWNKGLRYAAFPCAALRDELADARARSVIVLLDCCFSGRAGSAPYPADLDNFATTRSSGGYLLASAEPNELAYAPSGERYTAFTGELIRLLREGDPAGPSELTLDHLYRCLDRVLPEQGRPRPRRYAVGRTGELALAPNPAYRPPVLSRPRPFDQARAEAGGICPYRGLKAYDVGDARYFFGREALTQHLVTRLAEQLPEAGMMAVVGPSGAGKSSLLRAGLIPVLDEGLPNIPGSRHWPKLVFTPGANPIATLANRLAPFASEKVETLRTRLAADPTELSSVADAVLSRYARGDNPTGCRLVLVVDQLEEVFTTCKDPQEQQAFFQALRHAAVSSAVVVLGLRADFYAQFVAESPLVDVLQHHQLIVTPMSAKELKDAIEKPAAQVGLELEPGLVSQMLDELGSIDNIDHASGNGGLPFLSHALFATWQQREGNVLTLAGYAATGRIREAVTRTAEELYEKLTATEQNTLRQVLLRMVHLGEGGAEDTRRRVRRADLPATEATSKVLTTFADARLITLGENTAEIAHEALLRAWPRLREWIDTDRRGNLIRQKLEDDAAAWDQNRRNTDRLYRGSRLEDARTQAGSTSQESDLSPTASAFLTASTHQERRTTRRRRAVIAVLCMLLLAASVLAFVASQQRTTAQNARNTAIFNQLTAEAGQLRGTDTSLAAQLDFTAYRMRPTPELRTALLATENAVLSTPLIGHTDQVLTVAFSPDGRTLATGSQDHTVRLWNVTDPTHPSPLGVLRGHSDDVNIVAFSPDGRTLATGSGDKTVRLWNATDPTHPTFLGRIDHTSWVGAVVFSPDGHTLASGSGDGTVRLWNVTDPAHPSPLGTPLTGHSGWVKAVAFSPDGHTLASGSSDKTVRLWDVADLAHPRLVKVLAGHESWVFTVAFSPDGHTLASGGNDKTVRLWNVTDPTHATPLGAPLRNHTASVMAIAFSPDGHTLASASQDRTVLLWDMSDLSRPSLRGPPLVGHTNWVLAVAFSPDGRTLASGGQDKTVRLWNIPSTIITGHTDWVLAVAFSPDGRTLATGDGNYVATGSDSHTLRLWNVTDPTYPRALSVTHTDAINTIAFSPDGHILATGHGYFEATGSDNSAVRLWNVTDPAHPNLLGPPLMGHSRAVGSVAFSPNGHVLATGSDDHTVRLWNITDPAHPNLLPQSLTGTFRGTVAFSPDGHTLVTGSDPSTARLQNVTDPTHPTLLAVLPPEHTNAVFAVAFSPHGHVLATGSVDQTVRLWDVTDLTHPSPLGPPLRLHTGAVYSVAFSPDGHTLATASADKTVRLWNVADPAHPQALGVLTAHIDEVDAVALSSNGYTLATGSNDHTTRLWDLNVNHAIQRICATTPNTLTKDKWQQYVSADLPYNPPCP